MKDKAMAATDTARSRVTDTREDRRFRRQDVKVEINFESETNFYNGFTENISTGGLFIATYDLQPMGYRMKVEFSLPNRKDNVSVEGVVRWIRDYNPTTPDMIPGMGLKFDQLSERDARDINEFIKLKEPIFFDDDL